METVGLAAGGESTVAHRGHTIATGIRKRPVASASVDEHGLAGDRRFDPRHHGGCDQAVCAMPIEHYEHWRSALGLPLVAPAFGENLTSAGVLEKDVCVGDVWTVGELRLLVTMPRTPCYKLAAVHGSRRLVDGVRATGRSGWYYRVLAPGPLRLGDRPSLSERPHPEWSIARTNEAVRSRDAAMLAELLALPELGERLRRRVERTVAG